MGKMSHLKDIRDWTEKSDVHMLTRSVLAFDLDDTLTLDGTLPSFIVSSLEALQKKSIRTVLVSGRSAGWADALIKLLPFDGVVAENGALIFYWPRLKKNKGEREEPQRLFWNEDSFAKSPPKSLGEKKEKAARSILNQFPGTRIASDQPYRLYDLAIDFAEEVNPPLGLDVAKGIQQAFEAQGATAKVSSIHVNGWWGNFSKSEGLKKLLSCFDPSLSLKNDLIYVGDSPNDGPLFDVAGLSVGVANIKDFIGVVDFMHPQFVTVGKRAYGALELINKVLELKK